MLGLCENRGRTSRCIRPHTGSTRRGLVVIVRSLRDCPFGLGGRLSFTLGQKMKITLTTILLLFAYTSWMYAAEISEANYTDKTQKTIRLVIGEEVKEITAPKGKFWNHLIVCKNRKTAFLY